LFLGIHEGVIDTIGSDHAPHTLSEKTKIYGECPSGMPGIEFMLPLLLNAYNQNLLTLDHVVRLTSKQARNIFSIPSDEDYVLVDLDKVKTITKTESKCGWSPYTGLTLRGWPVWTILAGHPYQFS
jgi:dihydroorotase